MGGLLMIVAVAVVAVLGFAATRVADRRSGEARREFQRAMHGLETSAVGGPGGLAMARTGGGVVASSGALTLRERRRIVSLLTMGVALGALGGAVAVPDKPAAGVAAAAAIVAVGYQITAEAIRRRHRTA